MSTDYKKLIDGANKLATELGLKRIVISLKSNPKPTTIFRRGEITFFAEHDSFWGGGRDFVRTIQDPTWADVLRAADESVAITGDRHHTFLESVQYDRKKKHYHFWFGS